MSTLAIDMSVSLDGFVAGPNDGLDNPLGDGGSRLFEWWWSGDEYVGPEGDDRFKPSASSREVAREKFSYGAVITGRRTFDIARGWRGQHPLGCPFFVLTHRPVEKWVGPGTGGTVVTEGIGFALELARRAAGDRVVAICGGRTAQEFLHAGLVEELRLSVVPVILGGGTALFDDTGGPPIQLDCASVVAAEGVTHLRYRVRPT